MNIAHSVLVSSALVLAGVVPIASAQDGHKMFSPEEIKWASAPPSIPPGAEAVVLYGDPSKDEMFAMRLKFPKGYKIAPHTHPKPEVLTVISGTFQFGHGRNGRSRQSQGLRARQLHRAFAGHGAFCLCRRRQHGRATQQHRALDPYLRKSCRRPSQEEQLRRMTSLSANSVPVASAGGIACGGGGFSKELTPQHSRREAVGHRIPRPTRGRGGQWSAQRHRHCALHAVGAA